MRRHPRTSRRIALAVMVSTLVAGEDARADIPRTISFQGRLADGTGTPVSGSAYNLAFRLYNVPTLGTPCFSESRPAVAVTGGVFALDIGGATAGGIGSACDFSQPHYLEVQVGTDPPMTPRAAMVPAAYALNVDRVDGLDSSQILRRNVTTGDVVVGGSLGIGTATMSQRVHVVGAAKAASMCIAGACISLWPPGTVFSINAGNGIMLSSNPITTSGSVGVDQSVVQSRIGSCSGTQAIGSIAVGGTATCNSIDGPLTCLWAANTYSPGAICRSGASGFTCQSNGTWLSGSADPLSMLPDC